MAEVIVVINAGSSSIKFSAHVAADARLPRLFSGKIDGIGSRSRCIVRDGEGKVLEDHVWDGQALDHDQAVDHLFKILPERLQGHDLRAIGHRVVHGGQHYRAPVRIDAGVLEALQALVPLAPLHQPHNLAPIARIRVAMPGLPQVACFDTAFHSTQTDVQRAYALPEALTARGIRSYGFHGLSYEYIASVMAGRGNDFGERVIVLHLGNGASMCAMRDGRSVATSMGFTALDGLPMGTRCGALDPGVLLYLMSEMGMDHDRLQALLYEQSGLLGVSGISSDMRTLEASDAPRARFAVELFTHRIARELGALAAALGGLDALVFTAGIGENSVHVRGQACRDAGWIGVRLDEAANASGAERISAADSAVSAWIIPTDEEWIIARDTATLSAES